MAAPVSNLWPADFGQEQLLAPVAILRQQAAALGELTQNIVVGRVSTYGTGDGFHHTFSLYCAPLAYSMELLTVDHALDFYPAKISMSSQPTLSVLPPVNAASPEDFSQRLANIFASEPVKKIIRSLLAQSKQ